MNRPGLRLRAFAARFCSEQTMDRLIDPTIADLQTEYVDARRRGAIWTARWVLSRGVFSVAKVVVNAAVGGAWHAINHWSPGEAAYLRRASIVFLAVTIVATMVFAYPQAHRYWDMDADLALLTIYLIPSILPLTTALAAVLAIVSGGIRERVTRKVTTALLMAAIGCSIAIFADMAWIAPNSNQAFRELVFSEMQARGELVFGQPPTRGDREMSMSELRRQMVLRPSETRRLAFTYHQRLSLSIAPLTLAGIALLLMRSVRQRTATVALGFGLCLGYWFLLQTAQQAVRIGGSVMLAAWSPNIIVALFIALLWPRRRLSPTS